jgi:tetratricopeptide (TPR) repeat protein
MWERIEIAREDSDMALFMNLTYMAEMILKTIVAGLAATINNDRERSRYGVIYKLVRADGLGDWVTALDDILTGPPAHSLTPDISYISRELTERVGKGQWQYEACELINLCLNIINDQNDVLPIKVDCRRWFREFVRLRNLTKAHGAPQGGKCSQVCDDFEKSLRIIYKNLSIFCLPWAYLHRNYSGKYRISSLTDENSVFDPLKKSSSGPLQNFPDGLYLFLGEYRNVDLIQSDPDLFDFFFPNGLFTVKKYELLSYITGNKKEGDSTKYIVPASELPSSETEGKLFLDILGQGFSNVPQPQEGYISRPDLEEELKQALLSENHPMITLRGRGGIGKTWVTLHVLHEIAKDKRFDAIIWFSARDIDLLPSGPKSVKPQIMEAEDIAKAYVDLLKTSEAKTEGFKAKKYFEDNLIKSRIGPTLFVFDNFETVKNPVELYSWLDTFIRYPNKILITTRVREFKADFNVDVYGMNESESESLILNTAKSFGIGHLLSTKYIQELVSESEGHPYVIKIMLGEVAKAKKLVKVERVVANSDEMLKALFERTYNNLSPAAKRVFLTLVNLHSIIPQLALEAVLLRPENERLDVLNAIDELEKSSFIEISKSKTDKQLFLTVPLVTIIFGEKKLIVSPLKSAIEADTEILRAFGDSQSSNINSGLQLWINRLFQSVNDSISENISTFDNYYPIIKFVASQYPEAWLYLASIYEENPVFENRLDKAKQAVQFFLESAKSVEKKRYAWQQMVIYNRRLDDWMGVTHAYVELSQLPNAKFDEISNSVNLMNSLLKDKLDIESDEKRILGTKLLEFMEKHVTTEGNGTDYSRMAWLARNIGLSVKAIEYIESGLKIDPENEYIQSIAKKFGIL